MTLTRSDIAGQLYRVRSRREYYWRHAMLLLAISFLACFFFWPLLQVFYRSFAVGGSFSYIDLNLTLQNYYDLFTDTAIVPILESTIVISLSSSLLTLVIAFPLAYLMSRVTSQTAIVIYSLVLLPLGVNILIRLFGVLQLFAPSGPVSWVLESFGFPGIRFLYTTEIVIFGMIIYLLPILTLILYSGMKSVEPSLITAAKAAGASGAQAFWRIFLPLVRSSTIGGTLLIFVLASGFFVTPDVLGSPSNMMVAVYIAGQVQSFQWGEASAAGVVLLACTLVIAMVAIRFSGLASLAGYGGGKGVGRSEPLHFSATSVVLWSVCALSIIILLAPLAMVVIGSVDPHLYPTWPPSDFSLTWYYEALSDPKWREAAFTSLRVALYAMLMATAIGFVGARTLLKTSSKSLGTFLVTLFYAPLLVPTVLLAIGTLDTQRMIGLFGTDIGLAAAQACLSVPFTITIFLAALRAIDHSLEQAAWSLGASRGQTTKRVILPLVLPSTVGAALISFLNSWDEVVVAIFQTSIGSATLPVLFYSYVKTGFKPTINAVGTLLIFFAIVLIVGSSIIRPIFSNKNSKL